MTKGGVVGAGLVGKTNGDGWATTICLGVKTDELGRLFFSGLGEADNPPTSYSQSFGLPGGSRQLIENHTTEDMSSFEGQVNVGREIDRWKRMSDMMREIFTREDLQNNMAAGDEPKHPVELARFSLLKKLSKTLPETRLYWKNHPEGDKRWK